MPLAELTSEWSHARGGDSWDRELNKAKLNRRTQNEDVLVGQTQVRALAWNGLEPDGTLTVEPDPWLTLAALPPWTILVIAILDLVIVGAAGVLLKSSSRWPSPIAERRTVFGAPDAGLDVAVSRSQGP